MSIDFDWKRFWYPRGTEIQTIDGFLIDPEDDFGKLYNPDIQPFESLADIPCLILLGEQGIGKSTTVKQTPEYVDDSARCFAVDVADFQTDSLLDNHIFSSKILDEWRSGNYLLHLHLDSLDEGAVTPDIAVAILLRKLIDYPLDRLRLRLVCRTAVWQADLENRLQALWQDNDCVKAYELAPLRAIDAEEAAKTCGLDQRAFLKEIYDKEVVPLATRPLTLKMLLDEYSTLQHLPLTCAAKNVHVVHHAAACDL